MKTIIAGCRNITDPAALEAALGDSGWKADITEVVCGMARGADMLGFDWANQYGIPVAKFPADWERYGKKAGPTRNRQMGDYADALIAIWDGSSPGTMHMISYMRHLGKPVTIRQWTPDRANPSPITGL